MSKQNKSKNKKETAKSNKAAKKRTAARNAKASAAPSFWGKHAMPIAVLFGLAFVLYAITISYDYALDDQLYITSNEFTKKGIAGIPDIVSKESLHGFWGKQNDVLVGGRYRPLAIVTYAIEYAMWGERPGSSHFFNIILYCFVGILLYRVLLRLFPPDPKTKWYLTLPFIAALLYVAHPLHSEVVANIKGRVEILTSLGVLLTMHLSLKYVDTDKIKYLIYSGIAFFLALLSKESAITFVAIIPLTIYYFSNASFKKNATAVAPLLAATIIFIGIRTAVIGYLLDPGGEGVTELLNDPFLNATFAEKYATIFYTLGIYIKLLFFPITLTHDYYPKQIPIINWADARAIIPLIGYFALGIYALIGLRKKDAISYGIWVYLLSFSIVSNVVISIGAFMNERFMYLPSIGFCIILAYLITEKLPKLVQLKGKYGIALIATVLLVSAYSVRTWMRLPAWENNETLFLTDVKNSPNSTKVNTSAGGTLVEKGARKPPNSRERINYISQGIKYLDKAIEIYPDNVNSHLLRAGGYYDMNKDYDKVFESYTNILAGNPNNPKVLTTLGIMAEAEDDPKNVDKLVAFLEEHVNTFDPAVAAPYDALGVLWGKKKNDLPKAIQYFEKALEKDPNSHGTMQDLGIAYGMAGKFDKALDINNRALKNDPGNAKIILNLAITYEQMGNTEQAQKFYTQAFELDPSLRQRK